MSNTPYTYNFNPGPAKLPNEILLQAQKECVYYKDTGISVMEMSHRSPDFEAIANNAEKLLREVMSIPDNYKVLFMHGGGTAQFAAIPLNLCSEGDKVNYVITGTWSEKAAKEAEKFGLKVNRVTPKPASFNSIPDPSTWNIESDAKYLFYTDNETIHGIEYPEEVKKSNPDMPIIVDMTSNFLTRPVDVSNFGVIIAGTQKNVGIAGLGLVIIREDLIGNPMKICPTIFDYKVMLANKSLYNTVPTYAIYMCGLYLEWIKKVGGLVEMSRRAKIRSELIYNIIDGSNGFYYCAVVPEARSRVNAVFRVGSVTGNDELEKKFFDETKKRSMIGVKGHRSVGGVRISMFNACPIQDVQDVADMMKQFMEQNA